MLNWFVEMRIHPIVVHFPIAMLTLAWVAIVAVHAGWGDTSKWKAYIGPLEWFGVIALAPTVLSGFRDAGWMELFETASFSQPLIWHVLLGLLTALLFTVHAFWRRNRDVAGKAVRLDVGLASAGFWALVVTGLLAGEVVYG
jgi:uncharacterized membrane protein